MIEESGYHDDKADECIGMACELGHETKEAIFVGGRLYQQWLDEQAKGTSWETFVEQIEKQIDALEEGEEE